MDSKKKILVFAHDASLYGATLSLLSILENLSEIDQVEFFVFLPSNGSIETKLKELNIKYDIIPFPRSVIAKPHRYYKRVTEKIKYVVNYYKTFSLLKKAILVFKPDLIYSNTISSRVGFKISRALKIPHVWHIREYLDGSQYFYSLQSYNVIKREILKSNQVIFASKILKDLWIGDINCPNCQVIYNGFFDKNFLQMNLVQKSNVINFGLIGYIIPEKGQLNLIKAMIILIGSHPNIHLHFYGHIVDKQYYKELLKTMRAFDCEKNVTFHGYIEEKKVIYSNLYALVSFTKFFGISRTIIESMCFGVPVITNKLTGVDEIIKHFETGVFCDNEPESIGNMMKVLIEDKLLYTKISNQAKNQAINEFSISNYVNAMSNVFKKITIKS